MKKIIPILVVGVLILSGLGAVAITEGDMKQAFLPFSNLTVQEEDNFITLGLEGTNSVLMRKNHYMVPMHIETFTFPFGTEIKNVQCTPKNIHRQTITKELMIAPDPVVIGQLVSEKVQKNVEPIAINSWYEYDVGTGLNVNERNVFVKVTTFPVQYHPSENIVEWAENIEIDIDYKEPTQPVTFGNGYSLIVLGPDEFSEELDDLVTHKNNRGVSTIFVSLNDIYTGVYFPVEGRDNKEKIKYFIKNAIEDENWGASNVLLVGGSAKFPTRTTHIRIDDDEELFVSDLYYADIYNDTGGFSSWDTNENDIFGEYKWNGETDDVDLYPDVYLGRLACTNAGQVTDVVDKIITYETNEAYAQEWFTNLVVVGGDSFTNDPHYGDDSGVDEGELVNQEIMDVMGGFIPDKIWDSNGRLGKIIPPYGRGEINNAINSGCGWIDFSGHGNPQVWATHPHNSSIGIWIPTPQGYYTNSQVSGLSNGDELPIVLIGGCSVLKYNSDSSCFGWSFVSNPNGGGIASFGPTALGYAYIGKDVTYGLIEGMSLEMFEAYKDGSITLGEVWSKAVTNYIKGHSMRDADLKTVEEYQPFADPTLAIGGESQAPEKPDAPEGPTSGMINEEHTYTASTTDPDGDKIYYLFDWDDGEFSGWVGPYNSGATASASHTWTKQGDYEIRVKAKDEHGVQSEWSDPLSTTMPKSKGYINFMFLEILEKLMERFPLLEQILSSRPFISRLLDLC